MRKNAKKKVVEGGWGCYNSPLWPRYHPIWFKTSTLKDNCLFKLLLGKKGKKTNISPFLATHTNIKLTFVSFFFIFFLNLSHIKVILNQQTFSVSSLKTFNKRDTFELKRSLVPCLTNSSQ